MGKDPALASPATAATAWRPASVPGPQGAGRHFVDTAQRGSVAGFARGVSVAGDLLAAAAGLGRARRLAQDLAGVPGRVE